MMKHSSRGFTILEMLLAISVIGVLTGFSAPIVARLQRSNDLETAQRSLIQAHRRSQQLARSSINDQTWGVKVQTGLVTTFVGISYATRDTTYDEDFQISNAISISGLNETVYNKTTANPSGVGTTTLQNNGQTKVITVNAKGTIDY